MASSSKIDVEYEIDDEDGGMDTLDFQDIPHSATNTEKGKTHEFTNFPNSAIDSEDELEEDTSKLLQDEKAAPSSTSSFWTFAYYQQFFNVDTKQVGVRILGSMMPRPGRNYLIKEIRPNPDLYGPFWICVTLVFTTAIAGNLANYFSSAGDYHWRYDFHKVTLAATAIFSYWWLIPLVLFGVMWWQGYRDRFSFLEMICVYGYSLAIYIPISVLWAIQVAWLQWILVVLGAVVSGSVLLMTFWPVVSEGNKKVAIGVMIFIFVMHMALAAGFVLYFFYVPAVAATNHTSPAPVNPSVAPIHPKTQAPPASNIVKQKQAPAQPAAVTKDTQSNLIDKLKPSNNANVNSRGARGENPQNQHNKDIFGTGRTNNQQQQQPQSQNVPNTGNVQDQQPSGVVGNDNDATQKPMPQSKPIVQNQNVSNTKTNTVTDSSSVAKRSDRKSQLNSNRLVRNHS